MRVDLKERRGKVASQIERLMQKRGAQTLDGKAFADRSRLTSLQNELEAVDERA